MYNVLYKCCIIYVKLYSIYINKGWSEMKVSLLFKFITFKILHKSKQKFRLSQIGILTTNCDF